MNKKLFIKRLCISLFCVLAPFAVLGALIWIGMVFGDYVAATITIALYLSIVLKYLWEDICWYLDQWIDWLKVRKDPAGLDVLAHSAKGNDGQPD